MKVETLQKESLYLYDKFIKTLGYSMLYHTSAYGKLVSKITQSELHYKVVVNENGEIVGALPLIIKEGPLGKVANSLPFYGSHGGVLTHSSEAAHLLIDYFNSMTDVSRIASAVYIENPFAPPEFSSGLQYNYQDSRIGQWTPLSSKDGFDELMAKFHYKTRNSIRKALKNNISISINNDAWAFLYETHKENMSAIGGRAKPKEFFDLIPYYFNAGSDYNIFVAKKNGEPICALLIFYYNRFVEYFTPAIVQDYRSVQPLSLVIVEAMLDAARRGFLIWNWGGTWKSQNGVYRFKNKWNTTNKEYKYFIRIHNEKILSIDECDLSVLYENFYVYPFDRL